MERLAPEQHDSLDGVPAPAENPRLYGHEAARRALAGAYRSGKLPHALLLVGPRGIGKATLAFHLANHLLSHPDAASAPETVAAPDPASPLFRQIASGAHPGVLHLTRPFNDRTKSFKSALTVDEIRRIGRFLSMTSHDGGYRVVIVDPADDMNVNAANALLKNLEEPPSKTLFVLVANSLGSLLPTIRSRCQILRLSPLEPQHLAAALAGIGMSGEGNPAFGEALAERSRGSVREAILLTQYGGADIAKALDALAGARRVAAADAHRLADAVAARDGKVRFDIFNERALDLLAEAGAAAARSSDLGRARRFSEAWQRARLAIEEAETYNLDRKQHALDMIFRLNDTFRM